MGDSMNISDAYCRIVKYTDSIDSLIVQRINIGLYLFVLFVISGGLLVRLRDHSVDYIFCLGIMMILTSLIGLVIVIISRITDLLYRASLMLSEILISMIIFLCAASGISFFASDIPPIRFSWTPGLITLTALYGHVFIVRRLIEVINHLSLKIALRWLSLGLVMIAGAVDVGVCIAFLVWGI